MPPRSDPALGQGHSIYTENPPPAWGQGHSIYTENPPPAWGQGHSIYTENPPLPGAKGILSTQAVAVPEDLAAKRPGRHKAPRSTLQPVGNSALFFPIRDRATPGNSRHLQVLSPAQAGSVRWIKHGVLAPCGKECIILMGPQRQEGCGSGCGV
jgi:hypothetical protein